MPPAQAKRAAPVKTFPAEVVPLQSPSHNFPIAPDCKSHTQQHSINFAQSYMYATSGLIPNSTIRESIGYIPAPDPLSVQQQKLAATIDRLMATTTSPDSPANMRRRKKHKSHKYSDSEDSLTTSTDACNEEEESSAEVAMGLESESENTVEEEGDVSERSDDSAVMAVATSSSLHHLCHSDDSCGENSFSELRMPTSVAHSASSLHEIGITSTQPSSCLKRSSHSSMKGQECQISSSDAQVDSKRVHSLTRNAALNLNKVEPSTAVETKVVPTVTIPFQMGPTQATATGATIHTGSVHSGTTTGAEGESEGREIEVHANRKGGNKTDVSQNTTVLQQITDRGRVASNHGETAMNAEVVCDEIGTLHMCSYHFLLPISDCVLIHF